MVRMLGIALLMFAVGEATAEDALHVVNQQRAKRGLPAYQRDEALSVAALKAATFRAENQLFGHTSNDFAFLPPGSSADAAGCAAYPQSYGFMACATYESYKFAGAASVRGRNGLYYHHLFVKSQTTYSQTTYSYSYSQSYSSSSSNRRIFRRR